MLPPLLVIALLLILLSWITIRRRMNALSIEAMIGRLEKRIFSDAFDLIEEREGIYDDSLIFHIIGTKGFVLIWMNAGILVSILSVAAKEFPTLKEDYSRLWWSSIALRLKIFGVFRDAVAHLLFPHWPCFNAREYLRIYCEMTCDVDGIASDYQLIPAGKIASLKATV